MRTVIIGNGAGQSFEGLPAAVRELLPFRLADELRRGEGGVYRISKIEEIHLRCGKYASLTCGGDNISLRYCATPEELSALMERACEGSLYAHLDTIRQGFVSYRGVRIGICGRAALEGGRICGVRDIASAVIRIPHPTPRGVGAELAGLLRDGGLCSGALIYAPPGVGKTTVLRGVAASLASGASPLRVAVIDSRFELATGLDGAGLLVDILSGYPKSEGILCAARTLAAQVIVCDEIGGGEDAEAIMSVHNCGVPMLAATHAATPSELLSRPGIARLHAHHSFSWYIGLSRAPGEFRYNYDIQSAAQLDAAAGLVEKNGDS